MDRTPSELTLQNDVLKLTLQPPTDPPFSHRFANVPVIREASYRGHTFCQPEQRRPHRRTTNGVGFCSELFLDGAATQAEQGGYFPKPGVGLLRQLPEGGEYLRWNHYEVLPGPVEMEREGDRVRYRQQLRPCLGYAAAIQQEVALQPEGFRITTTVENTGRREMPLREYNHNFVAIDGLPVGPGYALELPSDGAISDLRGTVTHSEGEHKGDPAAEVIRADGHTLLWDKSMEGLEFSKVTPGEAILPKDRTFWKLSHQEAGVYLRETVEFRPGRLVLWAVEHCVCTELYHYTVIPPGEFRRWARSWDLGETG